MTNYIKTLFLPYELSLELKRLGYNEDGFAVYYNGDFHEHGIMNEFLPDITYCSALLYQQAVDWFEKYGIYINITCSIHSNPIWYDWEINTRNGNVINSNEEQSYSSKYEALNAAIIKSVEIFPLELT